MSGGTIAQVAVGRYLLQLGDPCGAVIREALRAERSPFRPRTTPVLLRPRLIRGLVDRQIDVAAALSALDAGLAVEISGEPGVGKTAVLRHLAHHPRAAAFVDGIVYVSARHHAPLDLQQLLFEAFYESDAFCKPTDAEIRRGLQDKQALILLDDAHLAQNELEEVLNVVPRASFIVATRERRLWRETHTLTLKGLPAEDAVALLEREIERPLDENERAAAATLCAGVGGNPLRVLQAAGVIREQGLSLDQSARIIAQTPVVSLIALADEKQRRALLALAALPGVLLQARHVCAIAEVGEIEPALTALVRRGLVITSESRYELAEGVGDRLRRAEDLKPWTNRAITYFTAWAERHQRSQDTLRQESEALLRVQEHAADARRSGEVLQLGRFLEESLVAGSRWGAWAVALERCLAAARSIGDRSAEAWALHELGSRALCLGDAGTARALLNQAVTLRESANDAAAAAASQRNLGFVLPPVFEYADLRETTPPRRVMDLGSLPLRDAPPPPGSIPTTHRPIAALLALLMLAILAGLAYQTHRAGVRGFVQAGIDKATARIEKMRTVRQAAPEQEASHQDSRSPVPPGSESVVLATDVALGDPEPQAPTPDRASILIFTPRPGSIATRGPTRLCYAVSDALQVRLEPEIGDITPSRTLTCLRVAPARTTTYELAAQGRDGHWVSRELVIIVR